MPQTLEDFVEEAKRTLTDFEAYWRKKHAEDPVAWPLQMEPGNEGLWWEFLSTFDNGGCE